jgi:hypothetical protein
MAGIAAIGSPVVRTTTAIAPGGNCIYGTYIVGGGGCRRSLYFVSRTTPTISV